MRIGCGLAEATLVSSYISDVRSRLQVRGNNFLGGGGADHTLSSFFDGGSTVVLPTSCRPTYCRPIAYLSDCAA